VIPVLDRYGADARIAGWEIWNEPDAFCNGNVAPHGVLDCSPNDYVDLASRVAPAIRARSGAPVVGAATTSINQGGNSNFDYNKDLVGAGLLNFIDVYNFHWYSSQLEKLTFGGIANFLNDTASPSGVPRAENAARPTSSGMRATSSPRSTTTSIASSASTSTRTSTASDRPTRSDSWRTTESNRTCTNSCATRSNARARRRASSL